MRHVIDLELTDEQEMVVRDLARMTGHPVADIVRRLVHGDLDGCASSEVVFTEHAKQIADDEQCG